MHFSISPRSLRSAIALRRLLVTLQVAAMVRMDWTLRNDIRWFWVEYLLLNLRVVNNLLLYNLLLLVRVLLLEQIFGHKFCGHHLINALGSKNCVDRMAHVVLANACLVIVIDLERFLLGLEEVSPRFYLFDENAGINPLILAS